MDKIIRVMLEKQFRANGQYIKREKNALQGHVKHIKEVQGWVDEHLALIKKSELENKAIRKALKNK